VERTTVMERSSIEDGGDEDSSYVSGPLAWSRMPCLGSGKVGEAELTPALSSARHDVRSRRPKRVNRPSSASSGLIVFGP